jgi:tripartite-type tricarboxylate transporter receptor subunit TctC
MAKAFSFRLSPFDFRLRAATALAAALICTSAAAQQFPARPVRVIVPFAPGGSTDVVFRVIAPRVTELLGQPLLIDNRPGGGATIGMDLVAKAPADGYTLGVANISFGANPSLLARLPYDTARDFAPVSMVSIVTMVLAVHPSVPARSVKDLLALAKKNPDGLTYGSAGNGSATHLAYARFNHASGAKILHVPYKGGGPAVVSAVSGETMTLFATIPSAIQHFQAGRLVPLGVSSPKRNSALPQIPTVAESGVPGYEAIEWQGVVAPAGTPAPVVQRLSQAFAKAITAPEMKDRLTAIGADAAGGTPEELAAFIKSELANWAKVIRESGIKLE